MIAPAEDACEIFLNPGEFYFGNQAARITTLLGSCVSITLWHPRKHIGGMCHYMLTERKRPANAPLDGRFADEAFDFFLRRVEAAGTLPSEYQAKLFGGASMQSDLPGGKIDIGPRNIAYGRARLASRNIVVVAEHVGGYGRRKLHFDVWSGNVWLSFPQGTNAQIRKADGSNDPSNCCR